MARADERSFCFQTVHHLEPGRARKFVVPVEAVLQLGPLGIDGAQHDVAEDEPPLAARDDGDARVSWRVARRRNRRDRVGEPPFSLDELEAAGALQRLHVAHEGIGWRLLSGVVLPVGFRNQVARPREQRPAAPPVDVPARVVPVEVGEHHCIHLIGPDARGGQLLEQLALVFGAPAGIDEDTPFAVQNEERPEVERDVPLAVEVPAEFAHEVPRRGVYRRRGVRLHVVDQRHDGHRTDLHAFH